ncbi:Biofilm PGA synthesis deacetylase PgaB (EC 3.-) [hydrothermal vent metagenome]|uniref:Biofilm PGA synthesis deacetylase PgaB (EC 3.-) n=1 Tax=hydrothermal vent metagenome TaxID=652676 RepID=A0A3B0ZCP5_9ZZZZ
MKRMRLFILLMLFISSQVHAEDTLQSFITFSYHDVSDDTTSVSARSVIFINSSELASQFAWMREHGYKPVSIDQIITAREGGKPLPAKAILLTFDDGYRSVYTRVYPLLKLFNYPAVIALVGQWMDVPAGEMVSYGDDLLPRKQFLEWSHVNEMVDSGLVEVASHSYDLHHGVQSNPQGNSQAAAITLRYDEASDTYENEAQFKQRLSQDLKRSVAQIKRHTGKAPRTLIWPYGAYNQQTIEIAASAGMPYTMNLDSGISHVTELANIRRILMPSDASLSSLVWALQPATPTPVRVAHIDLDYIYDPDPARQEKNLGLLLDRIKSLRINTVYLQAYADPDGDGHADALYYPNRHLPMKADLFNRVSWQLRTRANVNVYAWLPVLAYQFNSNHPLSQHYVKSVAAEYGKEAKMSYQRLSLFHPKVREVIGDLYEDLARQANFSGILFHDDAYLNDYEDSSPSALAHYRDAWGLPASIAEIRKRPALMEQWTKHKTQALIDFTHYLRDRVQDYHPTIKTARNIYARVIMQPASEEWFAQSLPAFIKNYDYTAIMAMPYMEEASNAEEWLKSLVSKAIQQTDNLSKVVFELQSVDWRNQQPIDSVELARHMRILQQQGALNFGYYPDDFIANHPLLDVIHPEFSLSTYPYAE